MNRESDAGGFVAPVGSGRTFDQVFQQAARPGRRIGLLPDAITSAGLLAGCLSFTSAISGRFERAGVMIGVSIACDIADGFVARASETSSEFGLEYDSLSDVVAFGVAPAVLSYAWALRPLGNWAVLIVGAFVICAALRLARFNIQAGTPSGKRRFVGLPVPGAALVVAGTFFGSRFFAIASASPLCVVMSVLMLGLAALMVSRVPYPNIKGVDLKSLSSPTTLVLIAVAAAFLIVLPELTAFCAAIAYLLSGPFLLLSKERAASA